MSDIAAHLRAAAAGDLDALVACIPYAVYLGIDVVGVEPGDDAARERRYRMPFRDDLIGNPRLPALHGGTVAGFLELAMQLEVLISQDQQRIPYSVDFAIDYWRAAGPHDCFASCRLIRSGRRIAQVQAECWQHERDRPVAFARADFLLRAADSADA